jgi:hypothetical protein
MPVQNKKEINGKKFKMMLNIKCPNNNKYKDIIVFSD